MTYTNKKFQVILYKHYTLILKQFTELRQILHVYRHATVLSAFIVRLFVAHSGEPHMSS